MRRQDEVLDKDQLNLINGLANIPDISPSRRLIRVEEAGHYRDLANMHPPNSNTLVFNPNTLQFDASIGDAVSTYHSTSISHSKSGNSEVENDVTPEELFLIHQMIEAERLEKLTKNQDDFDGLLSLNDSKVASQQSQTSCSTQDNRNLTPDEIWELSEVRLGVDLNRDNGISSSSNMYTLADKLNGPSMSREITILSSNESDNDFDNNFDKLELSDIGGTDSDTSDDENENQNSELDNSDFIAGSVVLNNMKSNVGPTIIRRQEVLSNDNNSAIEMSQRIIDMQLEQEATLRLQLQLNNQTSRLQLNSHSNQSGSINQLSGNKPNSNNELNHVPLWSGSALNSALSDHDEMIDISPQRKSQLNPRVTFNNQTVSNNQTANTNHYSTFTYYLEVQNLKHDNTTLELFPHRPMLFQWINDIISFNGSVEVDTQTLVEIDTDTIKIDKREPLRIYFLSKYCLNRPTASSTSQISVLIPTYYKIHEDFREQPFNIQIECRGIVTVVPCTIRLDRARMEYYFNLLIYHTNTPNSMSIDEFINKYPSMKVRIYISGSLLLDNDPHFMQ